jgi:hypothetical protein
VLAALVLACLVLAPMVVAPLVLARWVRRDALLGLRLRRLALLVRPAE